MDSSQSVHASPPRQDTSLIPLSHKKNQRSLEYQSYFSSFVSIHLIFGFLIRRKRVKHTSSRFLNSVSLFVFVILLSKCAVRCCGALLIIEDAVFIEAAKSHAASDSALEITCRPAQTCVVDRRLIRILVALAAAAAAGMTAAARAIPHHVSGSLPNADMLRASKRRTAVAATVLIAVTIHCYPFLS